MLEHTAKTISVAVQNERFGKAIADLFFFLLGLYASKEFLKEKIKRRLYRKKEFSEQVWEDIRLETLAMIKSARRVFRRGVSQRVIIRIASILTSLMAEGSKIREEFRKKYGYSSVPGFVTISPTNICNLKCKGCYAGENYKKEILDFDVLDWTIKELRNKFNVRFFVISGGEPFAYRSKGKSILDIFARNPDCFFLVFTNGTLITKKVASRLEKVANVTPAISVEGFREETEARRGPEVFDKILTAMKNLREKGVIFGISVTPMRHNANLLLSQDFMDFWFGEQGASYAWYFQYMPIGRSPNPELLVTPEQRVRMWEKTWEYIKKGYFIADFWNCGTVSRGCISAAKNGGYFHILWNGDITPCVFIPFKDKNNKLNNVYNLIKYKKSIVDAVNAPLFREIRAWQDKQQEHAKGARGEGRKCKCKDKGCRSKYGCGNLLMPCPIRDNSKEFYKILQKTKAVPFDEGAAHYKKLIESGFMPAYNDNCHKLMDFLWESHYVDKKKRKI